MRVFVILSCLAAVVLARPDVGGYNYPSPSRGQSGGLSGGYSGNNGYSYGGGSSLGNFGGGHNGGGGNGYSEQADIHKHFYIHSAPEDHDNGGPKHFTLGRAQTNYHVVFIKAPTSEKQKLVAEYAPQEQKTVVYVLAQKEHEIDANDIATPAPTQPSKPEVFFIKYKTAEEAAHAQQQIQAQYDALGGTSDVSDEGTAPLTSVEGSLNGGNGQFGGAGAASSHHGVAVSNQYLPAN